MNRKLKITLITLLVLGIVIAIPLIVLSFGRVDTGYVALCYDNIIANFSSTEVFGPGNHFIGLARQFIRIKQGPITVRVDSDTYTSDYFRLNCKLNVNYQFSNLSDFRTISQFNINFGDNYERTIQSIISKKVLSLLSQYPSTFYKSSTYNTTALQALLDSKLTTIFMYELGVQLAIEVLLQSLVVLGASQNIEAINQQIQTSLLELQRAENQRVEVSNFISKVKSRSQQEMDMIFEIVKKRTELVSSLIDKSANFNTGFNMSMFLLGNTVIRNNLTYFDTALKLTPQLYTLVQSTVF